MSSITRDNHYVPQWYQRGFLFNRSDKLHYLDLHPEKKILANARTIFMNEYSMRHPSTSFYGTDLYTTYFGKFINDEIERKLFGEIDNNGARAIKGFVSNDPIQWHTHFENLFDFIDAQKIRTPKGLDWIAKHYPKLHQNELMLEMQKIRQMHKTIWAQGVREIVSAENANIKFIISDHPITVYNHFYPPEHEKCKYPDDPEIALIGTQTIFPLDMNHCLILTNYEYAENPKGSDPKKRRKNARYFGEGMVRTDNFISSRFLDDIDVQKINLIIKSRAHRYIAAAKKEWLDPEHKIKNDWSELGEPLLPPKNELGRFGGEMFIGYENGTTHYQDAFGRTKPANDFHKRKVPNKISVNDPCGCGSGKKYKQCCRNKKISQRPSWDEISIRERNLILANGIIDILGLSKGKTWDDIRKELNNEQVKEIHELYSFLWPLDTDIVSLLPKPDNSLRVLYSGIIDPRVINETVISLTLYFDEVIIQNPMMHPDFVNPKFSPVLNPHQFKEQTLKNVYLLINLLPFIDSGYINFIPDPSIFDSHLLKELLSISEKKASLLSEDEVVKSKDAQLSEFLAKDSYERTIYAASKDQQKSFISQTLADATEEEVSAILDIYDQKKQQDPFALLQNDIYEGNEGQIMTLNMSPNFESSMFLSQVTGSIFLTSSDTRWKEVLASQHKESGITIYQWSDLTDCITNNEYIFNANPENILRFKEQGKLSSIRNVHKKIYSAIQKEEPTYGHKVQIAKIKKEYRTVQIKASSELSEVKEYNFPCKLHCIAPYGGIENNNVQRLLLTSNADNFLKNVPMAIYAEFNLKKV
ncbi:DUF4238 domain-containing protein [Sulfurovum sp. XTW-4]|uniref:DUF4238 domain-containing protein n=1 Tax=Sulfurovum xiamenensis TaxID=3019066 RepID=A0ABT7QTU1_9BACT|nr:DUF4238 domain-containing protein [Sulfurovum xiamenensis]MDM5264507.1 DUF4238 domain-containing protein [Sulfurovum xiamenensis]